MSSASRPSAVVAYIDHNTLQTGFENADDHQLHRTASPKSTASISRRPGNGICHQVQLERFGKPGKTLLGSATAIPPPAAASA